MSNARVSERLLRIRRRLPTGASLGYLLFAAGTCPIAWLAWSHRYDREGNPSLLLLLAWVVAGVTHSVVNDADRAHQIAALACVAVYTVLVVFMNELNEMLGAGMILVGGLGYFVSMIMGIPIERYRRRRDRRAGEPPASGGPA